jgi:hypothetical protein
MRRTAPETPVRPERSGGPGTFAGLSPRRRLLHRRTTNGGGVQCRQGAHKWRLGGVIRIGRCVRRWRQEARCDGLIRQDAPAKSRWRAARSCVAKRHRPRRANGGMPQLRRRYLGSSRSIPDIRQRTSQAPPARHARSVPRVAGGIATRMGRDAVRHGGSVARLAGVAKTHRAHRPRDRARPLAVFGRGRTRLDVDRRNKKVAVVLASESAMTLQ